MRIKTMVIIFITVLLTVVLMQNTEQVKFNFLFSTFYMPKLVMLTAVSVIAFILGVLVGRPKKVRSISGNHHDDDDDNNKPDTLSDEDRDYISHP
ncbi:hypothetical protein [Mucilaginibacter sp.]|uniref:hypothetical protein n=1 Tax=Mucilaginibacter sp. TaxID=1882438 RepID=UPI00262E6FF4|nr:hypothetical protein [Mucilaginibacter sp.]MDB5030726.1 hypothetical protein [Mucilaginibacter sp.]